MLLCATACHVAVKRRLSLSHRSGDGYSDGFLCNFRHTRLITPDLQGSIAQGGGEEGEEGRAGARRRTAAERPKLTFVGNHVANYSRGRERSATQLGIRQKARPLLAG